MAIGSSAEGIQSRTHGVKRSRHMLSKRVPFIRPKGAHCMLKPVFICH